MVPRENFSLQRNKPQVFDEPQYVDCSRRIFTRETYFYVECKLFLTKVTES